MKKLSYVKLYETWCLYFPFLFSSSVLQSFFLFPASSLFGTQQQLTHPPVKSSTLPLRKMPVFQGVAPWHTIFNSSCVIPLWDSATAYSPSDKELNSSSFNQSCFSGLIAVWCSHIILTGLSLFWCSPILIIKPYMHLYYFILSMVYFYSDRPPLLQRSVAPDLGGVSIYGVRIYIYLVYRKNGPWLCSLPLLQWYLNL